MYEGKNVQLDIRAKSNNNISFDIEMQSRFRDYLKFRKMFYLGKMTDELLGGKDNYPKLGKAFSINFYNFSYHDNATLPVYFGRHVHYWNAPRADPYVRSYRIRLLVRSSAWRAVNLTDG
ncbi:MAG: Rpn family recombination-promoting nuclease/putative transposase, partial [Desulfovibrio sp.]|nr:Rpn family recombination-promoting nuclease/putative transposase [Desulfovibrio sp.]